MTSRNPSRTHDVIPRSTSGTGAPSARRGLFVSYRRPTPNTALSTGTTAAQAVHKDATASQDDIIQRDEQGNYRLDLPNMAPLPRDEIKEERGMNSDAVPFFQLHLTLYSRSRKPPHRDVPQASRTDRFKWYVPRTLNHLIGTILH
jgi:hypothetical protein